MAVTNSPTSLAPTQNLPALLRHVRWLAGGTCSGKSTAAVALAEHFGCEVYSSDRAEHDWLTRCSAEQHPHLAAARAHRPGDNWRNRSPEEAFAAMAGRYGETINFLIEDLCARPSDRILLVDYYGVLPRDLAPLLTWPAQAAFLIPTQDFRRNALTRRYSDRDRARANWGDLDPATVLQMRLRRDALWDAEVTQQAHALNLPVLTTSEHQTPASIVQQLSKRFQLLPRTRA